MTADVADGWTGTGIAAGASTILGATIGDKAVFVTMTVSGDSAGLGATRKGALLYVKYIHVPITAQAHSKAMAARSLNESDPVKLVPCFLPATAAG